MRNIRLQKDSSRWFTSEDAEVSRGNPGPEELFWLSGSGQRWPIIISGAGCSSWERGNYWERTKSYDTILELVTGGNAEVVHNGQRYIVKEDEAFLLHQGSDHRYSCGPAGTLHKRSVVLRGAALQPILASTNLTNRTLIPVARPKVLEARMKKAADILKNSPAGLEQTLSCLAYEILAELIASAGGAHSDIVNKAMDLIHRNNARDLRNRELTEHTQASVPHLLNVFRKEIGTTPLHYHEQCRMAHACRLLLGNDCSIKEVAQMTGFEDQLYFSKVFRRNIGMSPREFRKSRRKGG
jgi:AraC-like DNA-binding protein